MSTPVRAALLSAALAVAAQIAFAQEKPKPAGATGQIGMENFHAQCIGCHGIPGYKTAFPEVYHVPKIAGQLSKQDIEDLAAWFASQKTGPLHDQR